MKRLQLSSIGIVAREILQAEHNGVSARVMGKTSRGLFLHLPGEQVIFLSYEKYRGPLTLNLVENAGQQHGFQYGDPVILDVNRIEFPVSRLVVITGEAELYTCPLPGLPPRESYHNHSSLLGRNIPVNLRSARRWIEQVAAGWRAGDEAVVITGLSNIMGLGIGLTPSGDDVVSGFLLAANRWGPILWSRGRYEARFRSIKAISETLVNQARSATGMLSAALIACSQRGLADERLMRVLDGIVTGDPGVEQCINALTAYGGSSGWDTLLGMSLALQVD